MTQTYFPFDSGAGASVTESEWRKMASLWLSDGVIRGDLDGLAVSQRATSANASVDVATGRAWVDGHFYESDAVENLTIDANSSGNARIDRIVVKADLSANTIALAVVKGTAAATPTPPALTQSASVWEIPLARVAVADSFTSIADADITDERQYAAGKQDWQHIPGTLAFSTDADAPTFVMTTGDDLTGLVPLGARFRCVQATAVVYGIVTAVASSSLTIYGGTDYTLADEAISSAEFSIAKVPVGFNADPAKWTESIVDTSDRTQASATADTFYNPGSLSLDVPIGAWRLRWEGQIGASTTARTHAAASSSATAVSDAALEASADFAPSTFYSAGVGREMPLLLAAKTTYYLIISTPTDGVTVGFYASTGKGSTVLRAICVYL